MKSLLGRTSTTTLHFYLSMRIKIVIKTLTNHFCYDKYQTNTTSNRQLPPRILVWKYRPESMAVNIGKVSVVWCIRLVCNKRSLLDVFSDEVFAFTDRTGTDISRAVTVDRERKSWPFFSWVYFLHFVVIWIIQERNKIRPAHDFDSGLLRTEPTVFLVQFWSSFDGSSWLNAI